MNYYGLIGSLMAKEGKGQELAQLLLRAADMLRETVGCHQYLVAQELADPDRIWVTEIWDSKDAHEASLKLEGVRELIQSARPLIAEAPGLGIQTKPLGGVNNQLFFNGSSHS